MGSVVSSLYGVFGPFLIPVVLFLLGLGGYLVLVRLGRVGLEKSDER